MTNGKVVKKEEERREKNMNSEKIVKKDEVGEENNREEGKMIKGEEWKEKSESLVIENSRRRRPGLMEKRRK